MAREQYVEELEYLDLEVEGPDGPEDGLISMTFSSGGMSSTFVLTCEDVEIIRDVLERAVAERDRSI